MAVEWSTLLGEVATGATPRARGRNSRGNHSRLPPPASRPWAGGAKFWNTAGVSQDGTIVLVCGTISLEGGH